MAFVTFEYHEAYHALINLKKHKDNYNPRDLAVRSNSSKDLNFKLEKGESPTTVIWKNSDSFRMSEHSYRRWCGIRFLIWLLLAFMVWLYSILGAQVLEHKYLKDPPHINCTNLEL